MYPEIGMQRPKNLAAIVLGLLLVACLAGWFVTREPAQEHPAPAPSSNQPSLIDQRLVQTAQRLAALADSHDELALSREALRLTDHEVDQAFATALREAMVREAPDTGPLRDLRARIAQLKTRVAAGQKRVAELTKSGASSDSSGGEAELAKAQLELNQDELDDAQQDLARQGGDEHARIDRALQEHEAAQHEVSQTPKQAASLPTGTLSEQVRALLDLNSRRAQVLLAKQQAANKAASLAKEHDALDQRLGRNPAPASQAATTDADNSDDNEDTAAVVARLQRLSDQRRTLTELDRRIQDSQQLATVYQRWTDLLDLRRRALLHLGLQSLGAILAILFVVVLLERTVHHAFRHKHADHRRILQLRMMAVIAIRVVGAAIALLIIFGPPTQLTTILGLATAGLTVVMKDFIVAFFGWFTLMGKNGIHLGDWVEIEGVGGEVIEIGVLKTVLLEMGNWTNTGHPTGRHVSFVNSFAIEGHYFNFSTAGQWLWDELQVMLPHQGDPYHMAEEIRQVVEKETEEDARQAELDWERVTHQYGTRTFSAKPAVDLRPSINRLDVNVRYITRAPQRYEVKSRLFQRIVEMLHQAANATQAG